MNKAKTIPVYVLNLDRSPDRLVAVQRSAAEFGIEVIRVAAVDGSALTPQQEAEIDMRRFERFCGKKVLAAEIGCYLSHLKALEIIADGADDFAVIIEDDVQFTSDFAAFLSDLGGTKGWDLVKLVNHRTSGFIKYLSMGENFALGRCLHGSLGSSAAYAVRREAAKNLLKSLRPMVVPVDVELERGWANGAAVFTTDKPVVRLSAVASTIVVRNVSYKAMKFPFYRRIGTLIYRASEYARRIAYALTPASLSRATHTAP